MKKPLFVILLLFLCSISVWSQNPAPIVVTVQKANIREHPAINSKVLGKVKRGQKLVASAYQGDWFYVIFGNIRGWMHGSTIELDETRATNNSNKSTGKVSDYSKVYENEWLYYAATEDGSTYYYNPSKAWRKGSLVSVWIEERDTNDKEVLAKALLQVDCVGQKIRTLASVKYYSFIEYANRREKRRLSTPDTFENSNSQFSIIFPDSIGESLAKVVCKL